MKMEAALAFLRHALTYGGGFLTSFGIASVDEVATTADAFVTIGAAATTIYGMAWSWHRKYKNKPRRE